MAEQAREAVGGASAARASGSEYDVAIVGASLAGCAAAIAYGRAGLRVALVEKRPEMAAYKRICSHYIQSSAVASLERLRLIEPMMHAGAVRSRVRVRTPWGWVEPTERSKVPSGVNLRREVLDPLLRQTAADTPGVELMPGLTVDELLRDRDAVAGIRARDTRGSSATLRARLVVGADGRGSKVAELAGVPTKTVKHGRFAYGGYFDGPTPRCGPDATLWMLDPDMAAVFPTDSNLCFYACMPTFERLAEFRRDPLASLVSHVSSVPDPPPIGESRLVGQVQGKIDMTNVQHTPTGPGLALVGDAALAIDPLWGVGCGWAFQSSEWLTDSTIAALRGEEPLRRALVRYSRRHRRRLKGHARAIYDYTSGRKFNRAERALMTAAVHDERVAEIFEAFGSRNIGQTQMLATAIPRVALLGARSRLSKRLAGRPAQGAAEAKRA